jgi:mitochondrial fission protein ELM1
VAVLVGGDSRHHRFTADDVQRLLGHLDTLARSGVSLMITISRRTPAALTAGLRRLAAERRGYIWSGEGRNPYMALLALAEAIVVTADSTNMVGEAAATGAPILLFEPSGGADKITQFLDSLRRRGALTAFRGRLEGGRYEPLDATSEIAEAVADRFVGTGPCSVRSRRLDLPAREERTAWRTFTPS